MVNRGRKPSGSIARVRFSGEKYLVCQYSTARWRKITIKIFSLSFDKARTDIFQTDCFHFFPHNNSPT